MEGLGEHESEDNKMLSETNKKRRFKTPFQVQSLEQFYNEHKYPTDAAKAELAVKLDLSEKQISGWFCHRRLKDRRLLSEEGNPVGKQDLSSGVIQDHGSGLRQDSCSSTKQGDHRLTDPREVESRRLGNEELPLPDLQYEQSRALYDASEMDDTSSESNLAMQDAFHPRMENVMEMEAPVPLYVMPPEFVPKSRGRTGPSGYLKIKGQSENVAVTAVKRQLGRQYREDGPPLGVDFEPLPPGAFESPSGNAMQEPFRGTERIPVSLDVRGACWPPNLKSDPHLEAMKLKLAQVSEQDGHVPSHRQLKKKSNHGSTVRTQKPSSTDDAYITEEKPAYGGDVTPSMREHGSYGIKPESFSNHHHIDPSSGKMTVKEGEPWLNDNDEKMNPVGLPKRPVFQSRDSDLKPRYKDPPEEDDIFLRYRMVDVRPNAGKVSGEKGMIKDGQTAVGTMKRVPSELKVGKKERHIMQRGHVTARSSLQEITHPTPKPVTLQEITHPTPKPVSGSLMDMPSSFSEDETAETSSSVD